MSATSLPLKPRMKLWPVWFELPKKSEFRTVAQLGGMMGSVGDVPCAGDVGGVAAAFGDTVELQGRVTVVR